MKMYLQYITFVMLKVVRDGDQKQAILQVHNNLNSIEFRPAVQYAYLMLFFYCLNVLKQIIILISERACYKAQEQGKEFAEAYLFTKVLASTVHHPILFNFKANMVATRLLTGYTDRKYRQLLKSALSFGLVYLEGNHLRLYSRTKERREFKIRQRHKEQEIKQSELLPFYQIAVLKRNINKQEVKINQKSSTASKGSGSCGDPNFDLTLSIRKVAQLLHVSLSYAHTLTKRLYGFGLRLKQNRRVCSRDEFYFHRYFGSPLAHLFRYDQATSEHYQLKTSIASFVNYTW